jgi:hypothetical protein
MAETSTRANTKRVYPFGIRDLNLIFTNTLQSVIFNGVSISI